MWRIKHLSCLLELYILEICKGAFSSKCQNRVPSTARIVGGAPWKYRKLHARQQISSRQPDRLGCSETGTSAGGFLICAYCQLAAVWTRASSLSDWQYRHCGMPSGCAVAVPRAAFSAHAERSCSKCHRCQARKQMAERWTCMGWNRCQMYVPTIYALA